MGVFTSGGVGFDLGSSNVTIYLENEGVVLREPSFLLTNADNPLEILAYGREARQMLGRTPQYVSPDSPVQSGAVADADQATALIQALSDRAIGKRHSLDRSRVVVTMPEGLTRVELAALKKAVRGAGARKAALLSAPVAAALGAGISLNDPRGMMLVLLGGGVMEVAVLSMNGISASRSVRMGANRFDQAIVRYIRREKGLIIGLRTAEDLKIDIGSAVESRLTENFEVLLRGCDARSGKPATVSVTAGDVRLALQNPISDILETIREAFENTPPELAGDILEKGIQLSGGACQLEGLNTRLSEMTRLPVRVSEAPQDDAAIGAGMAASDDRLYARLLQAGSLIEL